MTDFVEHSASRDSAQRLSAKKLATLKSVLSERNAQSDRVKNMGSKERASLVRSSISKLAGLLQGGAGVRYRVSEAEEKAAENPRSRKPKDLMEINAGLDDDDVIRQLSEVDAAIQEVRTSYGMGLEDDIDPEFAVFSATYADCKDTVDPDDREQQIAELRERFETMVAGLENAPTGPKTP